MKTNIIKLLQSLQKIKNTRRRIGFVAGAILHDQCVEIAQKALDKNDRSEPDGQAEKEGAGLGYDALWTWFGLGRASFLIMPRVLMHEMPDGWQAKMAALLHEYDETFTRWPEGWGVRAQLTNNGKMIPAPEWLLNYRHPDLPAINSLRPNTQDRKRANHAH